MMDGYQASHDPAREFTVEPTTGRKLNILDVPTGKSSSTSSGKRASRRYSRDVPTGRGLPPEDIRSPMPQRPCQTAHLVKADYSQATLEQLTKAFGNTAIDESDEESDFESDNDSDCPSLSSSISRSSSSSVSSTGSSCSCARFGITRAGQRVKIDCGGSRCGSDQDCSSESEEEAYKKTVRSTRRHGVVIRS